MKVAVRLLGGFHLEVDERAVPDDAWHHRRPAELVKLLALAPGHRLAHERAIEALWPELPPDAGAANLRKAAHLARQAIGEPDAVVLRGGHVALFPDAEVWTDVEAFRAAAERALAADDPDLCAAAAELYGGDLLPDDRYDDWAIEAREPLRQRHLALLRRRGLWERLVEADPLDEEAHRCLMRAHAAAGNRAAALQQYRRLRDALARAGLRPDPATVALQEEIARGPAAVAPISQGAPIAGRERELARARSAWRAAAAGRGGALLVIGEAGAGKTRLCEQLLAEAAAEGATTIRGEAREQEGSIPYAPVAEALDRLLLQRPDFAAGLGEAAQAQLTQLTSELPTPVLTADAKLERRRIFSAVGQVVSTAARECGAVLLADDLHAADEASLQLIHYLVRLARFQRLLVLLAYREEEASSALAAIRSSLLGQRAAAEIRLGPLPPEAVCEIVERVAGQPPSEAVAQEISTLTGGNPFFAAELAAHIRPDGSIEVPTELYAVLEAGLARLEPEVRQALERVAVAGVEFGADELVTLTGLCERDGFEVLDRALATGVVEEWESGYRFRHVLVRDALERSLPAHRRSAAHRHLAGRLAAAGASPARIAHHLMRAGTPGEAVRWLERAARHAASVGALSDALRLADDALAKARPEQLPGLLELRADLLYAIGRPEAAGAYAEALATAEPDAALRLRVGRARAQLAAGELEAAERSLEGVEPASAEQRVAVLLARGLVACHAMDAARAEALAAEARELAASHRLGREAGEATALLALSAHMKGAWSAHFRREFLETLRQAPEAAAEMLDTHMCFAEWALDGSDSPDAVAAYARELRATADDCRADRGRAIAALMLGEAELLGGRLSSAEACLDDAVALMRAAGMDGGEALALMRRADVELARDRREQAAALLAPALGLARASALAPHLIVRAFAGIVRAAPDLPSRIAAVGEAEANLSEWDVCEPCSMGFLVTAAETRAREGDLARARDQLEQAGRISAMWQGGTWPAAVREARAALCRAEGDSERADALVREAADLFERAGRPLDAARCRTRLLAHA